MDTPEPAPSFTVRVDGAHDPSETDLRYRAFFDNGPDGVVILDTATGHPIEFNEQACSQLGYSREEFARLSLRDIDVAQSDEEIRATIAGVFMDGKADFDTVQRRKRGDLRNVHVTAQVITVNDRKFYHCVWRDITERKRMEAALRVSQERLSLAQRSAAAGIWDWDMATGRLVWSDEFYELFGLDPRAHEASFETWETLVHPEDRRAAADRIREAVAAHLPLANEYRIVRPDGALRWITALGNTRP